MHEQLQAELDQLAAAFADYGEVISTSADDYPEVANARERLRAAMRRFSETSVAVTGWGNPLVQLHLDSPDPNQPESESQGT